MSTLEVGLAPIAEKSRRPQPALIVAGLIILGMLAGAYWFMREADAPTAQQAYATAHAEKRDLERVVAATGTLSPVTEVQVGTQVTGTIKALHVDFNDPVEAGQVIAEIDPGLINSQVAQAKARLRSAEASVAQAEARAVLADAQLARLSPLLERGAVSKVEVDSARADASANRAQVLVSKAQVTEAKANLDNVNTTLGYTKILSPIDGVVVSRDVEVGQTVAASLSAPTLFVIAGDLKDMEVHTSVAEADIGVLAVDMPVEFSVDAFSGERFSGRVKQVRYAATVVSNVVTYDAVVAVHNPDLKLRPGMTANATFVVAEVKDALSVPNAALRFRPAVAGQEKATGNKSKGPTLYLLKAGEAVATAVEIGLTDGSFTEVVSGVTPSDLVITGNGDGAAGAARGGGSRRGPPTVF